MNKKIVSIFIMMLLIVTFALPSVSSNSTFEDDAPVWEVGDKWTYSITPITIEVDKDGNTLNANLDIGDLTLEVVSVSSDSYNVELYAEINGDFDLYIDLFSLELTGEFANTLFTKSELEGNMVFRKSDLGIKEMNLQLSFTMKLKIFNILPFRAPAVIELNIDFDNPLKSLDFPLSVGKIWGNLYNIVTIDGQISSKWLNFISFINNIFKFLPSEIGELLPVIDISDLIEFAGGDNSFEIPGSDVSFECVNQEVITVPAGTFNAYKIQIYGDKGTLYYAPDAGMVVKISDLSLQEFLPFLGNITFSLSDTNYN